MVHLGFWRISSLILILRSVEGLTVVDHHSDDEYILEHEIVWDEAIAEAKKIETHSGPIPGCNSCTAQEMTYCKNGSVLSDHCCCESSYNEVFLFVAHTCRVGPEECKVQAGDCAEYSRLRECCCHSYLAAIWKYLANGAENVKLNLLVILGILGTVFGLFFTHS